MAFVNESPSDFTISSVREGFRQALNQVDAQCRSSSLYSCALIDGKEERGPESYPREDPSEAKVTVGTIHYSDVPMAERAVQLLAKGQADWGRTSPQRRADIIRKVGALMRSRRDYLSALMVREAGKPWKEADADTCEAIDFCDYYADLMVELGKPVKTAEVDGESNTYFYQPRGVALVISPWNFPLAIACGMTVAALVCGNATILKPAEQTSLIAFEFGKILLEAGVPSNVFALLPGAGETIGRALVDSPLVDVICFTGSKAVGLEIIRKAALVHPGQKNVKRVIAEMGGKNAIIVDEDADLDEAVKGVIYSAFGFSGQKCSACSRVLVVGDAYETFISRLCDATSDILVGPAKDASTLVGPIIDSESRARIDKTIQNATQSLKLGFRGKAPEFGHFVAPTIFRDVPFDSSIWNDEIFGPVVACASVATLKEAVERANDSQYALTGGLFSRSPSTIEYVRQEFKVGNLYINRSCTGALVCRQPFGGFKMSGVGSKAGGPDYLMQFMEPRTVTENTMRRGFTPDLKS